MNWIKEKVLPKFKAFVNKDNNEQTLWIKCNSCNQMIFHKEYKNNSMLAVASYNAGPNAVSRWLKQFGFDDVDAFVDKIPYPETRGYVESVFENYWNYLQIYNPEVSQLMEKHYAKYKN